MCIRDSICIEYCIGVLAVTADICADNITALAVCLNSRNGVFNVPHFLNGAVKIAQFYSQSVYLYLHILSAAKFHTALLGDISPVTGTVYPA